uniref:Tetratricopeptide repeat protein n=1 Tax=Desertifilum tharense IPPAS B-1220 TaxID=1781255 RepID=A0ACD5GNR5_9CYAN
MQDFNQAIKRYEEALSFRRRGGDALGEINTLNNLGDAYWGNRNYDETIRYLWCGATLGRSSPRSRWFATGN